MSSALARLSEFSAAIDRSPIRLWGGSPVKPHAFVMGLLFALALGVGTLLLPGDSERIAMLERDGKTGEALHILESQFEAGDRRQRTLFLLQSLYETAGNLPRLRQTLELLVGLRPRDTALQRQLGLFYKNTQDEPAYLRSLGQQIDVRYSEPACRELTGLLRRSGQFREELAALQKCRQKGYRKTEDMVRLASLLAAEGDLVQASLLLRGVDDLRRLKTDKERQQLFTVLLENDQPKEAQRRAVRWVRGSKDDGLALQLIGQLVADNKHDLAIELARETSVPGDSVFLSVAEVMVERAQMVAAQAILRGWLEKATALEPPVLSRFIVTALDAGDPDLALNAAQRLGLQKLPPETVALLARGLDAAGRRIDGDSLRASLKRAPGDPLLQPGTQASTGKGMGRFAWGNRTANLDAWRTALWRRLQDENAAKPVKSVLIPAPILKPSRSARDLMALKQSRKLKAMRNRFRAPVGGTNKQPVSSSPIPQPFSINGQ
jgi:tetratricopeptide (TPR) repeat protein